MSVPNEFRQEFLKDLQTIIERNKATNPPEPPRAYTTEEVRLQFIQHVRGLIQYWSHNPPPVDIAAKEALMTQAELIESRVSGCCHSLLALIDGSCVNMPGFKLIPNIHPDDKQFHIDEGENYYTAVESVVGEAAADDIDELDIGGNLAHGLYNA